LLAIALYETTADTNRSSSPHSICGSNHSRLPHRITVTAENASASHARILVVEDQEDVRRMLVTALELDGYRVGEAPNAVEGLNRLREARYNLVLSDYAMPGGTGEWMLSEATRLGLLRGATAVIVTAHPLAEQTSGIEIITKPVDLDSFLNQIRRLLGMSRDQQYTAEDRVDEFRGTDMPGDQSQHDEPYLVDLVLYVSSASPASIQARRNLERLLARCNSRQVRWTVRDLEGEPLAGAEDRIAFTPTLVKRFPEPRMWVLGNLRESEILADMLRVCGVELKE
jgi:CheY-like chemotaxis protein